MNRNKLIYTAAYGAFVVSSDYGKGGTWTGATENLRQNWTKEFIWNHSEYAGNMKLIERGAIPFELTDEKLYNQLMKKEVSYNQLDLFCEPAAIMVQEESTYCADSKAVVDIYDIVKEHITNHLGAGLNDQEASELFRVAKGQMSTWLKRLCQDGFVYREKGRYLKKKRVYEE